MRVALLVGDRRVELNARVARTPEERQRGFSGRTQLAPDEAILFAFPHDVNQPFSMAQTYAPLDMLFFNTRGQMVWMVDNASTRSFPYYVPVMYRYVLEVPGGWSRSRGIDRRAIIAWPVGGFTPPA